MIDGIPDKKSAENASPFPSSSRAVNTSGWLEMARAWQALL
jgi:hypothetical protein